VKSKVLITTFSLEQHRYEGRPASAGYPTAAGPRFRRPATSI